MKIRLVPDKDNKTLTILDDGIGMSDEDLVNNLGTIARSGTKNFMKNLKESGSGDLSMIGQFGVGFYSAYLVADNVVVRTKTHDGEELVWESDANKSYSISKSENPTLTRGTEMTLYLKEDALEYLDEKKLKDIVSRHSQYVNYDIELMVQKEIEVEEDNVATDDVGKDDVATDDVAKDDVATDTVSDGGDSKDNVATDTVSDGGDSKDNVATDDVVKDDVAKDDDAKDDDAKDDVATDTVSDGDDDSVSDVHTSDNSSEEKEPLTKKVKKMVSEWSHLNSQKPIWTRSKEDILEEEYKMFYKSITKDNDEMLAHKHFNVEGNMEFTGLLYLPGKAPFDMFNQKEKNTNNVKLYVKRVFIMDDCKDLVPDWMSFVKGIVDCKDLPLNVSREILQQSHTLKAVKSQITKKTIDLLTELALNRPADYDTFYSQFNKNLKLGVHEDEKNREKLSKLLRYKSLNHMDKDISLDDYVKNMKKGQNDIYFISGESVRSVINSPFLERLKSNGYDVLLHIDPLDEYVSQQLKEYDGKKMVNASSKALSMDESDEEKALKIQYEPLCKKMKELLGDSVNNVVASTRIVDSPACLVTDEHGYSANMQRIMKAQALGNNEMMQYMMGKKDMEINPKNSIIMKLKTEFDSNPNNLMLKDLTTLLYDLSLLTSGFSIDDPSTFAQRFNRMIKLGLSIDEEEEEEENKDEEELLKNLVDANKEVDAKLDENANETGGNANETGGNVDDDASDNSMEDVD